MDYIYIITALDGKRARPSNIFKDLKDAKEAVKDNFFDLWEAYTNKYVVIEKMPLGCPWMTKEVIWYGRERFETKPFINENGLKCIESKAYIFEIEKPKEYQSICNFGIG